MQIYAIELTVWNPNTLAEETLYFCSGPGFTTGAGETPAHTFFDPRVIQAATVRRDIFAQGAVIGSVKVGYGETILNNGDGELDYLIEYGFDAREIIIRVGPEGGSYPADFSSFVATMEQASFDRERLSIRLRDRNEELDVALQPTKFLGTNALPLGLEGEPANIKGKPKPILEGQVAAMVPVFVNTSKLIFQAGVLYTGVAASVFVVDYVFDQGVQLTSGGTYASEADLLNDLLAPTAGQWKSYGPYIRLGSTPAGWLAAQCRYPVGETNEVQYRAGEIWKRILFVYGRTAYQAWSQDDIDVLAAQNAATVGVFFDEEITVREALDRVARSVGAWWGVDRNGVFRLKRFDAPSGVPAATFVETDITKIERLPISDVTKGLPVFRARVKYGRNYALHDGDFAGSTTNYHKAYFAQEWRTATYTDSSIQTAHPLSQELEVETYLLNEADALVEAQRLQALYGVRRDRFDIRVALDVTSATLDLGDVISVSHNRFGLSAGKLFRIIGIEQDSRLNRLYLTVWG